MNPLVSAGFFQPVSLIGESERLTRGSVITRHTAAVRSADASTTPRQQRLGRKVYFVRDKKLSEPERLLKCFITINHLLHTSSSDEALMVGCYQKSLILT